MQISEDLSRLLLYKHDEEKFYLYEQQLTDGKRVTWIRGKEIQNTQIDYFSPNFDYYLDDKDKSINSVDHATLVKLPEKILQIIHKDRYYEIIHWKLEERCLKVEDKQRDSKQKKSLILRVLTQDMQDLLYLVQIKSQKSAYLKLVSSVKYPVYQDRLVCNKQWFHEDYTFDRLQKRIIEYQTQMIHAKVFNSELNYNPLRI